MSKSPEEYFTEQDFSVQNAGDPNFSPAERAFMDKYMGVREAEVLQKIGITGASAPDAEPDLHPAMQEEKSLDVVLRTVPEFQLVAFYLGNQEFTVPTLAVQEVIRSMPIAKLPSAPPQVAGVINLRGKVTPLVHIRDILGVTTPRLEDDKFIIVCRRQGLQVGLIIERVHTMYRVHQEDIDWGIETHLGINVDFIAGLLKLRDQLVGIISVDRVIAGILN